MFREATLEDVPFIHSLENMLFEEDTRMSKASIVHSIKSSKQHVMIGEQQDNRIGCMIYMNFNKSFRLYSLAIHPDFQNQGFGSLFMNYLIEQADLLYKNILLEVRADRPKLISFYQRYGFHSMHTLVDYYGLGVDGIKMIRKCKVNTSILENLVVIEKPIPWLPTDIGLTIVQASDYMNSERYGEFKGRVFNLCDSYKYQTIGYYVSLLAAARDNRVIPSITTINDFKNKTVLRSITDDINSLIQIELQGFPIEKFTMRIYFGLVKDKRFKRLAHELFLLFETPFLEVEFEQYDKWMINKASPFSKNLIKEEDYLFVKEAAKHYFSLKRFKTTRLKNYIYDLAILVNPDEQTPPSDKKALAMFQKAADDIGFYVELITKKDYRRLTEFDALFIRETTNVNDHTYDFARYAYSEGLALIDDPWSILKCSNKVYLYERMKKHHVPMPETIVVTPNNLKDPMFKKITYPVILKQPDSAFSKGVFKAVDYHDFLSKAKELLKISQLVILQEYMQSDFDWRIGILDNRAIFACKYFMAEGHWQIIDWTNNIELDGNTQTLDIVDVPKDVIDVAIKAALLIGNGLYGVDIKERDGKAYLIEINDNPNIDYGIEDAISKEGLYRHIMQVIFDRIDMERNMIRYI